MPTTFHNSVRICVIALCMLILSTLTASAAYQIEQIPNSDQVVGDFVVGPGKIELTIEPGATRTTELIVTNRMGEDRVFTFEIEDVRGSTNPEESVVLLGTDRGPYSLKDYIHIPEMSFVLKQGERARIPVAVSVPADAEPGGLYGSVLVTTKSSPVEGEPEPGSARSGAVIVSRIGTLFFVTVPGEVKHEGELADFTTIPNSEFFTSGPIHFALLFDNKGSIHLSPYGDIRIKNVFGQEVGAVRADPWFALPGSLRFRELVWDREYLLGYYTAEANINRGYDNIIDTKSVSFLVLPIGTVVGVFAGLVAFIFLIRLIGKNFQITRRTP